MANLTYNSYTFYDQNTADASKKCITTVRDGYTTVPDTSKKEKTAGVGGTGGASTTKKGGIAYHNISYISIPTLLKDIPTGSKISDASIQFTTLRADTNNMKGCTWYVCPCKTFDKKLTGKNKPTVYTSQKSSVSVPAVSTPKTSQEIIISATQCLQWMIQNSLYCLQVYTDRGSNRRYIKNPQASGNSNAVKVSITYDTKPTFSTSKISTDCVDANGNDSNYVQNTISFSASSDGDYYRYSYSAGSKYKGNSGWVKSTSYNMKIDANIPEGAAITAKIETAFFDSWQTSSSITSFERTDLQKNYKPSASIIGLPNSNAINTPKNAYYNTSTKNIIATGNIKITLGNITFYGIKRGFNGTSPYAKLITFNSSTSAKSSSRNTSNLDATISLPNKEQNNTVTCSISNGWNTWSSSCTIKSAAPLDWKKSGSLSNDKIQCNVSGQKFISKVTQSTDLPEPTHSVNVKKNNAVNGDTHTSSSSFSKGVSSVTLTHEISSYRYATQTKKVSYDFSISFTNIIGQTLSKSHTCNINIRPQIEGLSFKRNISDIFHHTTFAEDMQMGYNTFVAPKQWYFDKLTNTTENRWSNITVQVSSISDRDSNDDKILQIELKDKPTSSVNFIKDVASTKYTWSQTDDHSGTGHIKVRAYDGYNYGYDGDADSHTISVLSSVEPLPPTAVLILSYNRYIQDDEGDDTGAITDDDGNKYIPNGLASDTTCGPYIRVLVPLAGNKVPNTLENHIRIQVNVYQLDVLAYSNISDVSKSTVVYNGVQYHELFFPLNLLNKADSSGNLDTIKFKVCYVDRFDNVSAEYYNNQKYQAYERPIFDVCGTQGGGYRWLFISPRYFLSSDPYSETPPITNLINTKWQMNSDAHLVELLSNDANLIDIMDFKTDNENTTNIVYSSASLHSPSDYIVSETPILNNLTGTKWYFNSNINLTNEVTWNVNFRADGFSYDCSGFYIQLWNGVLDLTYLPNYNVAYDGTSWFNESWRTIEIIDGTDVTNPDLIDWLYNNATLIYDTNGVYNLTNTTWALQNEVILPDVFINANVTFTSNSTSYDSLSISNAVRYGTTNVVYENSNWTNNYYRVLHITGGEDVTNRLLIDWLVANSTTMYISYNVNDVRNVVCFVTTNETLPPSYNYEWLNNDDKSISFIDGENATDNTLISWFTDNASLEHTNIIEEDYLRTPIFYSKVLNNNTLPFYVQPYLYKKNSNGNIVEVTHNVGEVSTDDTITPWSRKIIDAGSTNIHAETLIDFVFLNDNNQRYYFELDTVYYVILKLYVNDTTTSISEMTPFDKNATYQLSYYYQREDVENAKIWGIDDYTPGNYVQAEQMNVINQYISRVWDSYMIEGEVPLINLYKHDIIVGQVPEEGHVEHELNYSIPLNPNYYYPEQIDGESTINLCGPDLEPGGTNTWFTKYIPWNGRDEDIQIQIPLQSESSGKRLTLTVRYYDDNLRQIYNNVDNSYVFNEIIATPASSKEGDITYGTPKFYCNEILTKQSFFTNVKYIKLQIVLDAGLTLLHDDTDILYLGGIQNTQQGYDDVIVPYRGATDRRTITIYTDAHGNMSKTAVINNMGECLNFLRSEIYGILGAKYNYNHQHDLIPLPIYPTDTSEHDSYIVSYNQESTQKYPGVGDIDTLAIDNLPYNDRCSIFSAFKDF